MMETEDKIIEVGGIRFQAGYLVFGGDRGPAIRVWGDVGGRPVQLLRFDCFENSPHYHYDPDGKNDHRNLDKSEVSDPLAWSLEQIRTHLPEMVADAGQPELARRLDMEAIATAIPQIEAAIRERIPA